MLDDITLLDIYDVVTVISPRGRNEEIKNRPSYGLSFCLDGQITYVCNGKTTISDKDHAILLPQGKTYRLYGNKSGSFPVINFECDGILCETISAVPISNREAFINDFEKLKALSLFDGNRFETMSILYHILHRLAAHAEIDRIIMPAIEYIKKNYSDSELKNSQLAQQCNISEVYLRRLFVKNFNATPKQFITDIRINKAKQLLAEGAFKIQTIAQLCGFSSQYHFCRIFKTKVGMTPTEYMLQNRIYGI